MDHSSTVEMNHISVVIPEALATIHQSPSLEGVPDTQSEEPASVNLNTNGNNTSTDESDTMVQAAVSQIAAVSEPPIVHRWYFKTDRDDDDEDEDRFWYFPAKHIQEGLYDVILGLSTDTLNVDLIETFTFRFADDQGMSLAPSEVSY
ncbi:hypothetical protein BGZ68_005896 [Mortierella alpina]|nr:hypothetical protein BGZ68_005896 [Mortierella alpina]